MFNGNGDDMRLNDHWVAVEKMKVRIMQFGLVIHKKIIGLLLCAKLSSDTHGTLIGTCTGKGTEK